MDIRQEKSLKVTVTHYDYSISLQTISEINDDFGEEIENISYPLFNGWSVGVATVGLSRTVSEINGDNVQNAVSVHHVFIAPTNWVPLDTL